MKHWIAIPLAAAAVVFLAVRIVAAVPLYQVTDLGAWDAPNGFRAIGINDNGQVVGTNYYGSGGVITVIGNAIGVGISDNGQVTGNNGHAILYSGGVMRDLGTLPGGVSSFGYGVNDSGQVTGSSQVTGGNQHAFLYSKGVMHDLGTLGGTSSFGGGINDDGQVAGTYYPNGAGPYAFLYSGGFMRDLGTLPGSTSSQATAINASGQVTGWSGFHAFLYSEGIMTDIGAGRGHAINDKGQVVGELGSQAILYSGGVMTNLNSLIDPSSGWVLNLGTGINDLGQIIGEGTIGGHTHSFLASPIIGSAVAWTGTSSANWADSGNWSGAIPGATAGTTNSDTAIFNQTAPNSPLTIDAGRNVQNITFDTANVSSLTVGTVGGNALLLTAGGTIQTTSTVVNPQTVNFPLVLEGDYSFTSGANSSSATLSFGSRITPGATSSTTTLTLNGTNTGANTISGVLADNSAGRLAVTKDGASLWILAGANTYSGDTIVLAGTLKFNITSGTPSIAAGVTATVASGATLELAGSVSALGAAGGNRAHIVNNSTATGVVVSGTNQVVGAIDGSGNVQVNAGSDLTANHIIQNALIIGGAAGSPALVTIDASDAAGNPLGQSLAESSGPMLAGALGSGDPMPLGISSPGLLDGSSGDDTSVLDSAQPPGVSGAGVAAVPEPSTILLSAIGLMSVLNGGIRQQSRNSRRRQSELRAIDTDRTPTIAK